MIIPSAARTPKMHATEIFPGCYVVSGAYDGPYEYFDGKPTSTDGMAVLLAWARRSDGAASVEDLFADLALMGANQPAVASAFWKAVRQGWLHLEADRRVTVCRERLPTG